LTTPGQCHTVKKKKTNRKSRAGQKKKVLGNGTNFCRRQSPAKKPGAEFSDPEKQDSPWPKEKKSEQNTALKKTTCKDLSDTKGVEKGWSNPDTKGAASGEGQDSPRRRDRGEKGVSWIWLREGGNQKNTRRGRKIWRAGQKRIQSWAPRKGDLGS